MHESPRPDALEDPVTPVATEPEQAPTAADPQSEPGAAATAARFPLWLIVGGFLIFALIAIYFGWKVFSPY